MCAVDAVIVEVLRGAVMRALEGPVRETVKLSIMLGHVEHCVTHKTGAKCPSTDELQVCPNVRRCTVLHCSNSRVAQP